MRTAIFASTTWEYVMFLSHSKPISLENLPSCSNIWRSRTRTAEISPPGRLVTQARNASFRVRGAHMLQTAIPAHPAHPPPPQCARGPASTSRARPRSGRPCAASNASGAAAAGWCCAPSPTPTPPRASAAAAAGPSPSRRSAYPPTTARCAPRAHRPPRRAPRADCQRASRRLRPLSRTAGRPVASATGRHGSDGGGRAPRRGGPAPPAAIRGRVPRWLPAARAHRLRFERPPPGQRTARMPKSSASMQAGVAAHFPRPLPISPHPGPAARRAAQNPPGPGRDPAGRRAAPARRCQSAPRPRARRRRH